MSKKWRENISAYLFCAPAYAVFTIFIFVPLIWAFFLSFTDFSIVTYLNPVFVGFGNYVRAFTDQYFLRSLWNTALFSVMYVPIVLFMGFLFAILLERNFRGNNFFRMALFIPSVISMVVASIVWMLILSSSPSGLANRFLGTFGVNAKGWLSDPKLALPSVAFVMVWKDFGYNMLIYIAGLQNIPDELYEAAEIDGATNFKRIFYITIPLLKPTTFFLTVTSIIDSFQIFTPIYIMTQGGPGYSTTTIVNYIYTKGFEEFEMGYATAISFILFVILLILTLIQKKGSKSENLLF
jgi:multiple sugar transport system permease protein